MTHKRAKHRKSKKTLILCALSTLSVGCVSLGLALCLVKSPTQKSVLYLAHAHEYQQQANAQYMNIDAQNYLLTQAALMSKMAIEQTPYNKGAWDKFSKILAQSSQLDDAMHARNIAGILGLEPLPTMGAMRSLLPARDLALLEPNALNGAQ